MTDHLQMLLALCGPDGPGNGAALFAALFTAGLLGSVVHCAPMCGPFVLAQVSSRMQRISAAHLCERQRLTQGVLLPYHAGRLSIYALLGALAAASGGLAGALPGAQWLPSVLLILGAMLFLSQATRRLFPGWRPFGRLASQGAAPWATKIATLARRIDRTRPAGGFLLGAVLGFLPCGFLYAALAVAASTGAPWRGAVAMLAFGLGTAPSLMVVGVAGQAGGRAWSRAMTALGPPLLLLNSVVLFVLAFARLAQPG